MGTIEELKLRDLSEQYLKGEDIDWEQLYAKGDYKKVSLPTYSYSKKRCWISFKEQKNSTFDPLYKSVIEYMDKLPENFREHVECIGKLNIYSVNIIMEMLRKHNFLCNEGAYHTYIEIIEKIKIVSKYERLFYALTDILEREGLVITDDQGIIVTKDIALDKWNQSQENLNRYKMQIVHDNQNMKPYLKLLDVCILNLEDIMCEKVMATSLIFENSSVNLLENVYKNNTYIDYYHKIFGHAVAKDIELRQALQGTERTIRILEIGAGTGGASAEVFKQIKKYKNIHYTYTDISITLLHYGQKRYGEEFDFVDFKKLNIEQNILMQGFELGIYDIVLAYDVLHATKNISQTVEKAKKFLKANGKIFILEPVKRQDYSTLTFGMLDGWWLYDDTEIRITHSPLISGNRWKKILYDAGFDKVANVEKELGFEGLIIGESDGRFEQEIHQNKKVIPSVSKDFQCKDTMMVIYDAWKEALGTKEIGVEDNYFDLGGDSIIAMKIIDDINNRMGIELNISNLMECETIKKLSEFIEQNYQVGSQTEYSSDKYSITSNLSIYDDYCIGKDSEKSIFIASSAQKRMFIEQNIQEERNVVYNLPKAFIIEGKLDIKCVQKSFEKIVERHDVLRTRFAQIGQEIVQIIYRNSDFQVEYEENYEKDYEKIVAEYVRPFNLEKEFLFRCKVVKIDDDKYILIVDMHHIISDGFSINLMIAEFTKLYAGDVLDDMQYQYKDYAVWQAEYRRKGYFEEEKKYWMKVFSKDISALNLPVDFSRESKKTYEGDTYSFEIESDLSKRIKDFVKEFKTTSFNVCLAGFYLMLAKYSGQEDIIIGTVIAGRQNPNFRNVLGMFVNTLAMRNFPQNNKTFADFLKEVEKNSLEGFANQEYQFEQLVEDLKLVRDASHNPLFDVVFIMQNMGEFRLNMEGFKISAYDYNYKSSKFDLALLIVEEPEGLMCTFEYSTTLYKYETIKRMSEHYQQLLKSAVSAADKKMSGIEMITDREKNMVLNVFNSSQYDYNCNNSLVDVIMEVVEKYPDKTALVFGDNRYTYSLINQMSNSISHSLSEYGCRKGDIIGIMMERSEYLVLSMLGTMKAGCIYLPIDPGYPEARINYMLEDSKCKVLITDKEFAGDIQFSGVVMRGDKAELYENKAENPNVELGASDLLYIIYTSGTTGKPKGVMLEHKGLVNYRNHCIRDLHITERDKILAFASPSFDAFESEMLMALTMGGELHLTTRECLMDPNHLNQYLKENKISVLTVPPFIAEKLDIDNLYLRTLLTAGSESKKMIAEKIGKKIDYYNAYGPTEDSICSTIWHYDVNSYNTVPIGIPIPNHRVYILDKNNKLAPIGLPGELCLSGIGLARGYLNCPELTDETFINNPYEKGEKLYHTGDVARWLEDGNIEYLGRMDNQVKIRGFRIELGEIEEVIQKMPDVIEVAVESWDDDGKYLSAYYVAEQKISQKEFRKRLGKSIPNYMIPSYFIKVDEIPLTINGKLDKNLLPHKNMWDEEGEKYDSRYEMTELELEVYECIKNILKINFCKVDEDLFDYGMDSLKVIQIVSELRKLGYKINVADIFNRPMISEIARMKGIENDYAISQKEHKDEEKKFANFEEDATDLKIIQLLEHYNRNLKTQIRMGKIIDTYTLSPIQKMFLHSARISGSVVDIECFLGDFAVQNAVLKILKMHDIFSAELFYEENKYIWKIHDMNNCIEIPVINLKTMEEGRRGEYCERLTKKIFHKRIDDEGIKYQVAIIKKNESMYRVIFQVDHLIYDGVSNEIIQSELRLLCHDLNIALGDIVSYSKYKKWLAKIATKNSMEEIMHKFQLQNYIDNRKKIQFANNEKAERKRFLFELPEQCDMIETIMQHILQLSSDIYKGNQLPVIMLSKGREYDSGSFYSIVGNCIDVIPQMISSQMNGEELMEVMKTVKESNINFMAFAEVHQEDELLKELMFSPNIILNIQGEIESIPQILDDVWPENLMDEWRGRMYIVRHGEKLEIIQIDGLNIKL